VFDPVTEQAAALLREFADHLETARFVPRRDRQSAGRTIKCLVDLIERNFEQMDSLDEQVNEVGADVAILTALLAGTLPDHEPVTVLHQHVSPVPCVPDRMLRHLRWEGLT
jgi:hypothetical protein